MAANTTTHFFGRTVLALAVFLFGFVLVNAFGAVPVEAAWNVPTCDPDDPAVGPTDPTCNVSAPLNVSSSDQTKAGALTVQNTVDAAALVIDEATGTGEGAVAITTSSTAGVGMTLTHGDPDDIGFQVSTATSASGVRIVQTGSGNGLSSQASTGAAVRASHTSGNAISLGTNNRSFDATGRARISTSTSSPALAVINTTSGSNTGVEVSTGGVSPTTTPVPTALGLPPLGSEGVRAASATTYGVLGFSQSSTGGGGVYGHGDGTTASGVLAMSDQYYGLQAYSFGDYGAFIGSDTTHAIYASTDEASVSYGGVFCSLGNNCGSIGGPVFSGIFDGRLWAAAKVSGGDAVATFENTDAASSTTAGMGLLIRNQEDTGFVTLPFTGPTNGSGIDVQVRKGYGIFSYSQDLSGVLAIGGASGISGFGQGGGSTGVYGATSSFDGNGGYFEINTDDADGEAVFVKNEGSVASGAAINRVYGIRVQHGTATLSNLAGQGAAIDAQSDIGVAVYGRAETLDAAAIWGVSESTGRSYGGLFEAEGANSAAVRAVQSNNAGAGVAIETIGIGLDVASTATGYPAVQIATTNIADGIILDVVNGIALDIDLSTNGTGIEITSNNGTGIFIDVPNDDLAINANSGTIYSSGQFRGGQFYSYDKAENTIYANINEPELLDTITLPSGPSVTEDIGGLLFDGSDIWVGMPSSSSSHQGVTRYNAVDGRESLSYGGLPSGTWNPGAMTRVGNEIYAFYVEDTFGNPRYIRYDMFDDTRVIRPISSGSPEPFTAAVYNGTDVWMGGETGVYRLTGSNTVSKEVNFGTGSVGPVKDMVIAAGYLWVTDFAGNKVRKIDMDTSSSINISVGQGPAGLAFDGAYLWVANSGNDSLTRINVLDDESTTFTLDSSFGTAPYRLAFDGSRLWVAMNGKLGAIEIANNLNEGTSISSSTFTDLIYDGTYLWGRTDSNLYKYAIGPGRGQGAPHISKGVYVVGNTSGDLYCMYIDDSGAATVSVSTTLSNCQ